jgi:hypothetical protein
MKPIILLSREKSSIASTWTEHLCVTKIHTHWKIGEYSYEWVGSVHDLIPHEQLYSPDGDLIVPEYWNGVRVIRIADGEYLEIDELFDRGVSAEFSSESISEAIHFAEAYSWSDLPDFDQAMDKLRTIVENSC